MAAPLHHNKPKAAAREIAGCPPEYSLMNAPMHRKKAAVASYTDDELMMSIWTRAVASYGRPSKHRCAPTSSPAPPTGRFSPSSHPTRRRLYGDLCANCGMIGCTSQKCAPSRVEIMSIPRIPHTCSSVDWECGVSGEQQLRY